MKKVLVIAGVVTSLVVGLAGMAAAANTAVDDAWTVQLRGWNGDATASTNSAGSAKFGTKPGFNDGYFVGTPDFDSYWANVQTTSVVVASTDLGVGTGDYASTDLRAPLAADQTKIWNLKLYGKSDFAGKGLGLSGWVLSTAKIDSDITIGLFQGFNASKVKWNTVGDHRVADFSGMDGLIWQFAAGSSGNSSSPAFTKVFSGTGAQDLQLVAISASTVPEPGSMLAMLSGLVGLVGYGIRRRK